MTIKKVKKILTCNYCGVEYSTQSYRESGSKYCSIDCRIKYRKKKKLEIIEKIKNGEAVKCPKHGLHSNWRLFKCYDGQAYHCKICDAEKQKINRESNPIKSIFFDCKNRKKYDFNLTEEYLKDLLNSQNNKCSYTGIEFSKTLKPSLDRIDSNKGYIKGNVQFILFEVNRMKTDLDEKRFLELCKLVAYSIKGEDRK